ncbi:MAG: TPM domain-containing protein [Treponema sp.]|nr:TPM domain-containing protein [Treponema sp.]
MVVLLPLAAQTPGKRLVFDDMGKISEQSLLELNQYAAELGDVYHLDVAYFLVSDTTTTLLEYTTDRYKAEGLGPNGFALTHDIERKLGRVVGFGTARRFITDEAEDHFMEAYRKPGGTYYDGVLAYLKAAGTFLSDLGAASLADKPPYVVDTAGLAPRGANFVIDETGNLSAAEVDALNEKASGILEKYKCAVYVWIVDLVPEEYAGSNDGMERYVDAFYEKHDLGFGEGKNGIILLLETGDVPGERDYFLNPHGACTRVFTDSKREILEDDHIIPAFREAFESGSFFPVADVFFDRALLGFETYALISIIGKLILIAAASILTPAIICGRWRRQMKTAKLAAAADSYIPQGGFRLTGQTDQFLYTTTTRVKIESSSSRSGGRSRSSSSGRSSGGKI